jgi:hypothetical protein
MTIERVLRWAAVLIAIAGAIDPSFVLNGRGRPRVSVFVQDDASMDLPVAGGQSGRLMAADIGARLKNDLRGDFEIVDNRDEAAAWTIVVGNRYPDEMFPGAGRVSTVTLSHRLAPNVSITSVVGPASVPVATTVRLRIDLRADGLAGSRSEVIVRAGGAAVGRAAHDWTSDQEAWSAEIAAVPIGSPPFRFEMDVSSRSAEETDLDNHAAVDVDLSPRLRIFVLEGRPSWASAFVRRALEDDPRFDVSGASQAAPRFAVTAGALPAAGPDRVDRFDDFDAIVAGGLETLSSSQVAALEHFVRERGGGVVLVPDSHAATAVARRLLPELATTERLLERPASLTRVSSPGSLEASELLEATAIPRAANVLTRGPGSDRPIVLAVPVGEGYVVFSGAMDAWRFRGDHDGGFAKFWRSTVAGLALSTRPPIDLQLSPVRAAPGERVDVTARVRPLERQRLGDRLAIDARVGSSNLRLWPDAAQGVFRGGFVADASRPSVQVTASIGDGSAKGVARLTVDSHARNARAPLELLAASHAGVNVDANHVADLERHLRGSVSANTERRTRSPMRSSWWFAPFAVCLSAEWWLRRKSGRR